MITTEPKLQTNAIQRLLRRPAISQPGKIIPRVRPDEFTTNWSYSKPRSVVSLEVSLKDFDTFATAPIVTILFVYTLE